MKDVTVSETNDDEYVSPECFRAYVNAEIKVPNTLIAVGPDVGHAAPHRYQRMKTSGPP